MTDNILVQAGAAAMIVKMLVDAVKMTPLQTVGWVPLALAFVFGQACSILLAMSTGDGLALTQKDLSTCVLTGFLAFGSAVGVTELHKRAEERKAAAPAGGTGE